MSSPTPYLLHVTSHPTHVSPQTWKQWYKFEHLPDFVHTNTAVRAALYEEIDLSGISSPEMKQNFLAVYHMEFEKFLETSNYRGVRSTSTLFEEDGAKSASFWGNGEFDVRCYGWVQTYDPRNLGEVPSPEMITAEAQPEDPDDYDDWFRSEHISQLAGYPGYRRTLRYKLGPKTPQTKEGDTPLFLAMHEVDDAKRWMEGRAEAARTTRPSDWAVKNVKGCRVFVVRGWRLVCAEGYPA